MLRPSAREVRDINFFLFRLVIDYPQQFDYIRNWSDRQGHIAPSPLAIHNLSLAIDDSHHSLLTPLSPSTIWDRRIQKARINDSQFQRTSLPITANGKAGGFAFSR